MLADPLACNKLCDGNKCKKTYQIIIDTKKRNVYQRCPCLKCYKSLNARDR